jgi:hypothetical protein
MLASEAQEEAREAGAPPALASALAGAGDDHVLGDWIGLREEDARRRGVERLARLLSSTGIEGDLRSAADQLWTECGY